MANIPADVLERISTHIILANCEKIEVRQGARGSLYEISPTKWKCIKGDSIKPPFRVYNIEITADMVAAARPQFDRTRNLMLLFVARDEVTGEFYSPRTVPFILQIGDHLDEIDKLDDIPSVVARFPEPDSLTTISLLTSRSSDGAWRSSVEKLADTLGGEQQKSLKETLAEPKIDFTEVTADTFVPQLREKKVEALKYQAFDTLNTFLQHIPAVGTAATAAASGTSNSVMTERQRKLATVVSELGGANRLEIGSLAPIEQWDGTLLKVSGTIGGPKGDRSFKADLKRNKTGGFRIWRIDIEP